MYIGKKMIKELSQSELAFVAGGNANSNSGINRGMSIRSSYALTIGHDPLPGRGQSKQSYFQSGLSDILAQ